MASTGGANPGAGRSHTSSFRRVLWRRRLGRCPLIEVVCKRSSPSVCCQGLRALSPIACVCWLTLLSIGSPLTGWASFAGVRSRSDPVFARRRGRIDLGQHLSRCRLEATGLHPDLLGHRGICCLCQSFCCGYGSQRTCGRILLALTPAPRLLVFSDLLGSADVTRQRVFILVCRYFARSRCFLSNYGRTPASRLA